MEVALAPDLERLVKEKVESGEYSNPGAVVREALNLLANRDRELGRLRAAVAPAIAQVNRGETMPLDIAKIIAEADAES